MFAGDSRDVALSALIMSHMTHCLSLLNLTTQQPVMYPGPDSIALLRHLPRLSTIPGSDDERDASEKASSSRWLDLCCGSGLHGVAAARSGRAQAVDFVDVNPRALRFALFNACLNRVQAKCNFFLGDLYNALGKESLVTYDAIVANPPCIPVPPPPSGTTTSKLFHEFSADPSGRGDGIIRKIIAGAPRFLRPRIAKARTIDPRAVTARRSIVHEQSLAPILSALEESSGGTEAATVFILRGISGSGKSTVAGRIQHAASKAGRSCTVCSADAYFTDKFTGTYVFNKNALGTAHAECFNVFKNALEPPSMEAFSTHPVVVVDNTNTRKIEYERYVQHADRIGATVHIVEITAPSEDAVMKSDLGGIDFVAMCSSRNVHGAPLSTCAAMYDRWQPDYRAITVPAAPCKTQGDEESVAPGPALQSGVLAVVAELPNPTVFAQSVLRPLLRDKWKFDSSCNPTSASANAGTRIRASVVHDSKPLSVSKYASWRGGMENMMVETKAWKLHLDRSGIHSIANSLIFVGTSLCAQPNTPVSNTKGRDTDCVASEGIDVVTFDTPRTWSVSDAESHRAVAEASRFALSEP